MDVHGNHFAAALSIDAKNGTGYFGAGARFVDLFENQTIGAYSGGTLPGSLDHLLSLVKVVDAWAWMSATSSNSHSMEASER